MSSKILEQLSYSKQKSMLLVKEAFKLVKAEKAYFILPVVLMLIAVAMLVYQGGPSLIVSFIYAGL